MPAPVAKPTIPPPSSGRGRNLELAPSHKAVRAYYTELARFTDLGTTHEGAVRDAFSTLLKHCAKKFEWTLVGEFAHPRKGRFPAKIDGALLNKWGLPRAYWEAKDSDDDLDREIKRKIADGYPTTNIVFQAPRRAILFQNGSRFCDVDITQPHELVDLLKALFRYEAPAIDRWEKAADEFGEKVPTLAQALVKIVDRERHANQTFAKAFAEFCELCRSSINQDIDNGAVFRMLVQHILTERIFRKVFNNPDFAQRNIIAIEIEKVVRALTSRAFNRDKFLTSLDRFYTTLEETAATIHDYGQKQSFLNCVYERFFQGFDAKTADTHGIVYTPQSIVGFMIRGVNDLLAKEFGTSLGDAGVHIIDPFVGTGNFVLNVMRSIPKTRIAAKYRTEIHANEIMLLPYYVAAMNIEHEYASLSGQYEPFEGLCLVDTFELAEPKQKSLAIISTENNQRVEKQKRAPIFVIIGNPPYNAGQDDENDHNKNRKYMVLDERVGETYATGSAARLLNALSDPYVKAFRWATDRLGDEGILAYVSNSSYVSDLPFDSMRRHLAQDFDAIYLLDLGGNVRKNPKLSGTTHNVFGIQVGVAIGLFVRRKRASGAPRNAEIFYARVTDDLRREAKYRFLDAAAGLGSIAWQRIAPTATHTWLRDGLRDEFDTFMALVPGRSGQSECSVFASCSNGLKSNSDSYIFDFDRQRLAKRAKRMVQSYNDELHRWRAEGKPSDLDRFLHVDETHLKWIRKTKRFLARDARASFNDEQIVPALYRPFVRKWAWFDRMFNEDTYRLPRYFPEAAQPGSNLGLLVTSHSQVDFSCQVTDRLPCLDVGGRPSFLLPMFAFDDGVRRENITDWSLSAFRAQYRDESISKLSIFRYVYALLHHQTYRARYETNLKRGLPRVPFAPDFWAFSAAGKRLIELHIDFDSQPQWPLVRQETPGKALDWRVERMRFSRDRRAVIYNDFLTLVGVPDVADKYRVGSRSALEWVVDQHRVSTDARSRIVSDPNQPDDPQHIVELVGKMVHVSVQTMKVVESLPPIA